MKRILIALLGVLLATGAMVTTQSAQAQSNLLDFSRPVNGTLDNNNLTDEWLFRGNQGEIVSFVAQTTDGGLDPVIEVLDRNFRQIAMNDDYFGRDASIIEYELPYSGQYLVRVMRHAKSNGGYQLIAFRGAPPRSTISPANNQQLANGTIESGQYIRGSITPEIPYSTWQYFGRAGDDLVIAMYGEAVGNEPTTLDPYLYLYSPSGRLLATNDDGGEELNAEIQYEVPNDGLYTIVASTYKLNTTGRYWLFMAVENLAIPGSSGREPIVTAPPQNSNFLGGIDVQTYCNALGYEDRLINERRNWSCIDSATESIAFVLEQSDYNAICQSQYSDQNASAALAGNSIIVAYNWQCFTTTAFEPTPQPQTTRYIGTLTPNYAVEVNVRDRDSLNSNILGVIDWRQSFPLIREQGSWYVIDFNGQDGYVSQRWANIVLD